MKTHDFNLNLGKVNRVKVRAVYARVQILGSSQPAGPHERQSLISAGQMAPVLLPGGHGNVGNISIEYFA